MSSIAVLLLLMTQLVRVISLPCRLTRSLSDHALFGHTFKTVTGATLERCTFNCEMEENCLSINYLLSTRTCEYNNKNLELSSFNMRKKKQWLYIGSVARDRPYALNSDCHCEENDSNSFLNTTCKEEKALGMESGAINDTQISLSSYHASSCRTCGRANHPNSTWFPQTDDSHQWYQITFDPQVKLITAVGTQGSDVKWNWIASYSLDYKSKDGRWTEYTEKCRKVIFLGNTLVNRKQIVKRRITCPFTASTLRLRPKSFVGRIALRVELFGCDMLP